MHVAPRSLDNPTDRYGRKQTINDQISRTSRPQIWSIAHVSALPMAKRPLRAHRHKWRGDVVCFSPLCSL